VNTRSSSGPTSGAIVRWASSAEESGVVAMLRGYWETAPAGLGDRNQG
jgi:hypothetical protein